MLFDLRSFNRAIAEFEQYRDLPAIVDECDAAVPAHFGRYDNANYEFQNTEYYPVFQVKLMKKILDLNATETVSVAQATSWSFYFEGERYFEGTRSFLTAGRHREAVPERLPDAVPARARTGCARPRTRRGRSRELDDTDGSSMPEEVDSLASRREDGTRRRAGLAAHRRPVPDRRGRDARSSVTVTRPARPGVPGPPLPDRCRPQQRLHRLEVPRLAAGPHRRRAGRDQGRQGLEEFEPARIRGDSRRRAFARRLTAPAVGIVVGLEAGKVDHPTTH